MGIGASAGGLAALKTFFAQVPKDSGLAYVVVVHLLPDRESHLAEVLQPHVRIPVQQVTQSVALAQNCVYIIPPNANLDTIDTHLRVTELEKRREERAPIDHFFRTLARSHDGDAIGVVLSGTGSDGTLGLREIKQAGGHCLVQDPAEAQFDGMPQSAIATGMPDLVLSVAEIPGAIFRIVQTQPRVPLVESGEDLEGDARHLLQKIFTQIRARTGRDFSRYKRSTLLRRIQRRMQLRQVEELSDYLQLLRDHAEEVQTLADDLLVTVTSFFRDEGVYRKLQERAIPELFKRKGADDAIRVWSVGCATGEEAYSLAILLLEEMTRRDISPRIQIFASDLHEHSLRRAREGFYPGDIEADVSPERLRRFFAKESDGYRIRKELRQMVVFAPHNLLSDPPFSRIDLISCRNLLIYLQRDVQRDIIELFHYALKPKGYLLLGTAESVDTTELFQAVDKSSSLYFKRDVRTREPRLPVFPVTHAHVPSERRPQVTNAESLSYGTLHQRLVERNAPPSALISPDDNVVHLSDHAGRYLLPPGGEPTSNIYRLARKELQIELRTALHAVRKSKAGLDSKPVEVSFNGESGVVVLHVRPALEPGHEGFVLVTFDEQKSTELAAFRKALSAGEPGSAKENVARRQIGQLQTELSDTQQRLQAIIEEYETSQEEMKASNEEMQSTNEELRSTMEELETSKEELQSMNEELQTVNQENRHKVEELSQLSGDLQNLMSATDIATLFLDRDLRILRFTPRLGELFNVRMTDRGRPLTDLTHRLGYDELADDARRVLANLAPLEREVEDEEQRWYLTRLMPYRSPDDRIEGVVITLVDITGRKRAEQALALEVEAMRRLARLSVHLIDPDGSDVLHEQILNTAVSIARSDFASLQVCTSERGRNELRLIGHRGFDPASVRFWERVGPDSNSACGKALLDGERVEIEDITAASFMAGSEELRMLLAMGVRAVQTIPLLSRSGQLLGAFSTHWREVHAVSEAERRVLDVLARQAADLLERQRAEERSRRMMNVEGVAVLTFSADGALIGANDAFLRMTGYTREQVTSGSLSWQDLTPPQYAAEREKQQRVLQETGHVEPCELELILADGSRSWVLLADATLGDGTMVEYCIDVSDRKEAEAQVSEHERRFRLLVEQIRDYAIFMLDTDGRASTWNEGVRRVLGFREAEFVGLDITDQIFTPEDVADGVPQRELEQAAKAGSASNDRWMRRKDGTRFWASGITTGVRDEQGTLLGFMKVMRDQTGQKQLQEELRQAAEAVAESSRRKDEFLATLAHELRNPLAPIRTGLEILRNKRHDPQALGEVLAMIERQSEQLVALVDDLTDVSRITHGTFKLQRRRVELSEVVRIAVESARPFIEAARHELTLDLPDEPVQIDADPHRLAQVLSNLLNNAAKYTQEPGQIQLSSVTNDGIVEFRVRDSGIGIEPDQLEQIFETFFQVKSDESHNTGLGVGLALTKQLVHMHGGEIEARSAGLGRGSEFVVRLPIVCPDSVTRQKAANKPAENSSPLRVLVIDDNHDAATSLDLLVSALGHEVRIAGDGQQGIELARAFRPHVVFLDIGMPRMNGYEAARSIRQQDWGDDVVLVALTGWGQEEDVQRTREAGFDHHLVKPTNGDTLLALLAEVAAESGRAAASP